MRIPFISLLAASAVALGGCAYGGIGLGYGDPYGYDSYGYGSPYGYGGYGYGTGYGYGYGSPYGYGGYGYGYGSPYGWYDGYYYPGTGYYVYDSYRQPHMWTDTQRTYWTQRRAHSRDGIKTATTTPNWTAFSRPLRSSATTEAARARARERIEQVRTNVREQRAERATARSERATARSTRDDYYTTTPRRRR